LPIWPDLPGIVAVATSDRLDAVDVPTLNLSDIKSIVEFILQNAKENLEVQTT
jgi:hypothetical protein